MPNTLDVTADNRLLRFSDDFQVAEIDNTGATKATTTWQAITAQNENQISFRFDGESATNLTAKYAFNDKNQLTLQITKQDGVPSDSAVWTLQGTIYIKTTDQLGYGLMDADGNSIGQIQVAVSSMDFAQGHDRLHLTFPDQSDTYITGNSDNQNLIASEYSSGGDLTSDLLAFTAATANTIDGAEADAPAQINFYGRWDMHENALVFVTKYDNTSSATPVAYLAIAGQIKGTNFGLIVQKDAFSLQINGNYQWNKNTLGWDLQVGYSPTDGLQATLEAGATIVGKDGTLKINGSATLKKNNQGQSFTFDFEADYSAKDQNISFSVQGANGSYEVHFSGDFKITNGDVNFQIVASDKNGQPSVTGSVAFGYWNKDANLKLALNAVLGPNGIQLSLDLEFQFYWGPTGPVAQLPQPPS